MKSVSGFVISVLVFMQTGTASAQNLSAQRIAETASTLATIAQRCHEFYDLDRELAKKSALIQISKGIEIFGDKYFEQAMMKEASVMGQKLAKETPFGWCSEIRGQMKQKGIKIFK